MNTTTRTYGRFEVRHEPPGYGAGDYAIYDTKNESNEPLCRIVLEQDAIRIADRFDSLIGGYEKMAADASAALKEAEAAKPPKRILAFTFDNYYPSGGTGDLLGFYDTVELAREAVRQRPRPSPSGGSYEIVNSATFEILESGHINSKGELE